MNPKKKFQFCNSSSLIEVLEELGYSFKKFGKYYKTNAVYRGGENTHSLVIYPNDNYFIDFVSNQKGSLFKLIGLTLNMEERNVPNFLKKNNFNIDNLEPSYKEKEEKKSIIKYSKTFDISLLNELSDIHTYWNNKNISTETLKLFRGGLATKGKMINRYVFPIFNENGSTIIGFVGRDTLNYENSERPKYKFIGNKNDFKWPLYLNKNTIFEKKEVILVESPHCVIKLWESGIKNVLCIFGIDISFTLINELLSLDPNKIIISLNNEPDNKNIGNNASEKLKNKLLKWFDNKQVKIFLPFKKDFGDQNIEENILWYDEMKKNIYGYQKTM